ncbi:MAG: SDR family oxidoreductase [Actinobacteria bacterium]|uniref:Unannotated protein n=1 Tax=freshwater metagenome TaxID=449393 RepID=A0A6J6NQA1_9ZZZZ|nr:SDR family oxidoreductase [Actinomycetota bacterium]
MSETRRLAVITGGASGIGRASAERFARDGYAVVIADIDGERGIETAAAIGANGGSAAFIHTDVANSDAVQAMVNQAIELFGEIAVLFNNAAFLDRENYGSVTETSEADWHRCIDVTLTGAFLCSRYVIPSMLRRSGGVIINNASVGGLVGFGRHAAYCSAKGGVIQLTREIAIDYAEQNIRCNAVCPGMIETEGTAATLEDPASRAKVLELPVMKRPGTPEEIANAVAFLASDEATFITGAILPVDGGWLLR